MNKPKFTMGPWTVWPSEHELNIHGPGQSAGYYTYVARLKKDETGEANAHLIAAAPELHAALKRAHDMLQAVAGDIEDGGSLDSLRGKYVLAILGVRDAAHAALAKAEGRS